MGREVASIFTTAGYIEQVFYRWSVSANPPKNDRWPPWPDIRFVLVPSVGKLRPCRGLILDWKGQGRSREALVVYFDDAALKPVRKMEWIAKSDLVPVPVDPNWRPRP